jgi:hypothetical protein
MESAMTKYADALSMDDTRAPARIPSHEAPSHGAPCRAGAENDQAVRWRHIASLLGASNAQWEKVAERTLRQARLADFLSSSERCNANAKIEVLDRPTAVSAVLSWRDSTGGSYGYQVWQKGTARRAGICAMSGTPIRRGDAIYRPGAASTRPSNASAMILASVLSRKFFDK